MPWVELKDVFHHLEALDLETGELHTRQANCMFGYRNSIFKHELAGKYLITSVTLRLDTRPELRLSYGAIQDTLDAMGITEPNIADVSQAVISIRQSKLPDPAELGNAGSFFRIRRSAENIMNNYKWSIRTYQVTQVLPPTL